MSKYSEVKHLSKENIIKNGSIFTPKALTRLAFSKCRDIIDPETIILDMGSGYGAFLDEFLSSGSKLISTEYDDLSYEFLKQEFPDVETFHENSLLNVSRKKYGIKKDDKLLIVGNPPYNDITSIYKKGEKGSIKCDEDIMSRDFGMCFMKAYDKLCADFVCVLHPLAYLIKKQNFRALGAFREHYTLIDATIFSSREFETIKKTNAEFPVVCALYKRSDDGMTFEDIEKFKFKIWKNREKFILEKIRTIDGIVPKYPTKNAKSKLQFYTLRDMNALLRNATFIEGPRYNGIDVSIDNLYLYAWLHFLKHNFNPPKISFIYGNLSPLYSEKIENPEIKNALVSFAYGDSSLVKEEFDKKEIEKMYGEMCPNKEKLDSILESLYL